MMLTLVVYLTLSALSQDSFGQEVNTSTLELVQILYRHGDRSPTNPFPTDTHKDYWTDGLGQLTNIGKQQEYELGLYIRQRYEGFLNDTYNHEEVLINATDSDRTLMSGYSNLAGLYPPYGEQVWNPDIFWQPIPVHTRPEEMDYIVGCDGYCPVFDVLLEQEKQSPELQRYNAENANVYAYVANNTGSKIKDIWDMNKVYDTLFCEQCHNLSWPSWVEPVWPNLVECHNLKFVYNFKPIPLCRLRGGPLLGHMINNMQLKVNGAADKRKAFIFSSHDSMVASFLSALLVFNDIAPPYASTVFVELHKLSDGNHGVEILYRNTTQNEPYVLQIPDCESPCNLDQFIDITAPMIPNNILYECGVTLEDIQRLLTS